MIAYMLLNIVLQAYILGTITLIMVKADERSKNYRDRMEGLKAFADANELPEV